MRFYDRNEKVNLSNLKLAVLKYFSDEHNGVELTEPLSYVVLRKGKNQKYTNIFEIFDIYDDIPVFERVPYSNTTYDGEDFGSKLRIVQGEEYLSSGPCYILLQEDLSSYFGKDSINMLELEEFMVNSKYYFKDRKELILFLFYVIILYSR